MNSSQKSATASRRRELMCWPLTELVREPATAGSTRQYGGWVIAGGKLYANGTYLGDVIGVRHAGIGISPVVIYEAADA